MALTLFRLSLGDPLQWNEQMGDPVTNEGGAPVPALRSALRHAVSISTLQPKPGEETVEKRLRARRQLRSMLNNAPFKLGGYYLAWDDDHDQNGWYIPDQGQMADFSGQGEGLATGIFKIENFNWILAGHPRTHRRAVSVTARDVRTGLWPRDYRRVIYSAADAAQPALSLTYLPPGVTDALSTGAIKAVTLVQLPAGADGGSGYVVEGVQDLSRISYEQPEASRNLGQVIAYDRRGQMTGPTTGPGTLWEEFYGPDWPYSWTPPESGTMDCPVLDNGRCRVRYDPTGADGWIIDVWTGSKWEEQGKVNVNRKEGSSIYACETVMSASLVEYNEHRAVVQVIMKAPSAPTVSREEVFITLQRGWSGPRFEVYPANNAAGEKVDASIEFSASGGETDAAAMTLNGTTPAIEATAKGTGHTGLFAFTALSPQDAGYFAFTRYGLPYGVVGAYTFTGGTVINTNGFSAGYGANRNTVAVAPAVSGKLGYTSLQLGFPSTQVQQAMEAETAELGSGTANTADAAASNGKAATATRTTDANAHVTQAKWPNSDHATYRVFARVRSSVLASKVKIYAKTTATTGATQVVSSETYVWVDLGAIVANESSLEIHAWLSAAGTLSVDRVEAFLIEDRNVAAGGLYEGAADLAQRTRIDDRILPTIVTRSV